MRRLALTAILVVQMAPTLQAAGPDYSDPKKTMATLTQAMAAGDVPAMEACYQISPAVQEPMQLMLGLTKASAQLRKAAIDKFGSDAEKAFQPHGFGGDPAQTRKAIDAADVEIHETHAVMTLHVAPNPGASVAETRVPFVNVNNQWKIDAAGMLGLDKPEAGKDLKRHLAVMAALTAVTNEVADQCNKGQFTSLQQLQQTLNEKVRSTLDTAAVAKGPATAPATAPTSKPATKPGKP